MNVWKYTENEDDFVKLAIPSLAHYVLCVAPDSAGRLKSWTNFCSKD